MSTHRTQTGGRIDRTRKVSFRFDGRTYTGQVGDTLASALLANGVHLTARSFKYHRPRGILAAGSEEPNALVAVWRDAARYTPNLRATQVEIYEGLQAGSQNRWPALGFDIGRINDALSRFFPAGFYYKTFMWPRRAWKSLYEPMIRRAAGIGIAPTLPDPDRYAQRYAHCEVLIVGAGPAGIAAALAAAKGGGRVLLCDEQSELGGSLLSETRAQIDGQSAAQWLAQALAELAANPRVTLLSRTTAFGYFPHNLVGLVQRVSEHRETALPGQIRERLWQVRAQQVVLATGAIERPLVFPGNDRPGVMLADAARTYLNRYGVRAGTRAVLVTADDTAYQSALELAAAGVAIAAIVDVRDQPGAQQLAAAHSAGIEIFAAGTVLGTRGALRLRAARIGQRDATGAVHFRRSVVCDLLLMSGGFTPSVHLFSQSRGKLEWSEELQAFVPGAAAEATRCAGACRGVFGLSRVLEDGAALFAAQHYEVSEDGPTPGAGWLGTLPQPVDADVGKAFVDFQHDVSLKDILLATREGFHSIEHIKRFTTTGMATDQGKTSNLNALAIAAQRLQKPPVEVGLTTFRMPFTPTTFGSFAGASRGELFDPVRRTPTHEWAEARGAVFEPVSLWMRARYFPQEGEDMHLCVKRECLAVRSACGLFDASTLGKIEIVGPDAAEFLNRLYVNNWSNLAVGRCRYGILCRDDGFIYDDGVIARLAPDRFHVTTTTGGAARVLAMMEDYRQTEWTDLAVWLTSTTEQWAVIAVQGPRARRVVETVVQGADLSAAALPHMALTRGYVSCEDAPQIPAMVFRVSFTGELGFEINVPAGYGRAVWDQVFEAGQAHGIVPYGTETMHVLRAEKGYIIVGQDTDGTVTPDDAGLAWAIGKTKPDFVGKRSLQRPSMNDAIRKQLVGLFCLSCTAPLEEGAQIVDSRGQSVPMKLIGHVTSSYDSAVLGKPIALALIAGGRARIGQRLFVPMPGGEIEVEVTSPVFYDEKGVRLNG
ncbi:MAG: sarcosine oxidase subunit alpha family protein [Proteobacteria bacterium]|nr:sarcosine oxidase subunit alpha family protein [Pseudomonadota bacterium]